MRELPRHGSWSAPVAWPSRRTLSLLSLLVLLLPGAEGRAIIIMMTSMMIMLVAHCAKAPVAVGRPRRPRAGKETQRVSRALASSTNGQGATGHRVRPCQRTVRDAWGKDPPEFFETAQRPRGATQFAAAVLPSKTRRTRCAGADAFPHVLDTSSREALRQPGAAHSRLICGRMDSTGHGSESGAGAIARYRGDPRSSPSSLYAASRGGRTVAQYVKPAATTSCAEPHNVDG